MKELEMFKSILNQSKKILVLTGAGMSTESGIPDFRSKEGIYQHTPETLLSRNFFFQKPKIFFEFLEKNLYMPEVQPNEGHKALSRWEEAGKEVQIITQNVDGLHQKAGSKSVIEFHGTMATATCYHPKCRKQYSMEELFLRKGKKEKFWECDCGPSSTKRYIKPDVVLYGDTGTWMSNGKFHEIRTMAWKADLILVLGTTLKVFPFSDIVRYRNKEIPTVIVNKGTTPFDKDKNVFVIHDNIGNILNKL